MAEREKIKKAKKNDGEEEMVEMDRLSDLPDGVLLHILSFVPETRFCVRTSVLSKRWNNLWASLPDLIFHKGESRNVPYKKFVRHVLSRRQNLPLNKFHLEYHAKDKSFITRIINYAISHNVQHCSLYLQIQSGHYLPSVSLSSLLPLFNISGSLKTLDLESFSDIHLLEDFTLPNLTSVRLYQCSFRNGAADVEPITIDPFVRLFNLKSLELVGCTVCGRSPNFKISGPQLHSLTIRGPSYHKIEIIAPKLQFLSWDFFSLWDCSNLDFPFLEIVEPVDTTFCFPSPRINKYRRLYNAEALVLSSDIIMDLMERHRNKLEDQSSPFVRLTTLKVKCPPHLMSSFNVPDKIIKYFGDNIRIEKIEDGRGISSVIGL